MGNKRTSRSSGGLASRRKKKLYHGGVAAEADQDSSEGAEGESRSSSGKKLKSCPPWLQEHFLEEKGTSLSSDSSSSDSGEESDADDVDLSRHGNRIVDLTCLQLLLDSCALCQSCKTGKLIISENVQIGLASELSVMCNNDSCSFSHSAQLSVKTARFYDVNRRSVLAMRRIGRGHAGLRKFCGVMNLPPPVTERSFIKHQKAIALAASTVADHSTKSAAEELKVLHPSSHVAVSFDGTWMKRGFSSLYGVFVAVSWDSGRVLDFHSSGKYCPECTMWYAMMENGKTTEERFSRWKLAHVCDINTGRSAPGMESEAACVLWNRSVAKHSLMYTTFIGDGDSKSHRAVVEAKPYGDLDVIKEECVGHVQKRLGTGLRELKRTWKGKKLDDGKLIGGAGRLTDKMADTLQTYYGMAIRSNPHSVKDMTTAIWAGIMHRCSTDDEPQHQWCPPGEDSWCKWQCLKVTGRQHEYQHSNSIPKAVFDKMQPLYWRLADKQLLDRCQLGATQNANESFNSVLWSMCPKEQFCSKVVVDLASSLAVCTFNNGAVSLVAILAAMHCSAGRFTEIAMRREDLVRIRKSDRKSTGKEKQSRKRRRRRRRGFEEQLVEVEGVTYQAGGF